MPEQRKIREVTFSGSAFERGFQRGQRLRETLVVTSVQGVTTEFVQACFEAATAAFPPAVDEFEGIVQGGGFDREAMMPYYFARVESRLGGCTMFAVDSEHRAGGDGPIVGRNYDWAVSDLRWCELQRVLLADGPRRIGYTHHWAGCADVLTEKGLYVAIASLPPADIEAPGVQWNTVMEMMAEQCRTVSEAVEACAAVRHLRPMSYLVADAAGGIGVLEATPREVRFRPPTEGMVLAANVPQGGRLVSNRTREKPRYVLPKPIRLAPPNYRSGALARARRRVERARALLNAAASLISEDDVAAVLADHEGPICTGDHTHPDGAPWGTIWSGMCAPAEGRFCIAPGLPCRHGYQCFTLARR